MTQLLENIFAWEVPKGTTSLAIIPAPNGNCTLMQGHVIGVGHLQLEGIYEILFTTKKCKEDQAQSVVGKEGVHPSWPHNPLYTNYSKSNLYIDDARESLKTLLHSHGLSTDKNYLLLKKLTPAISG